MSSFLDRRKEELKVAPNPCQISLAFNGSKGFFTTYDPSIEPREDRRQKLTGKKHEKIQLIVLDMAKKCQYIEKAKRGGSAISIGTSYFKDYDTDHIKVWENGAIATSGTYAEIKDWLNANKAKVVDVYFCWSPTLNAAVTFDATGGKKTILRRAWKKHGGWAAQPFIEIFQGKHIEDDDIPVPYYELGVNILEMTGITEKDGEKCDEIGPVVVEYLDSNINKTNDAAKMKAVVEAEEEENPTQTRKVGDPVVKDDEELEDVTESEYDDEGATEM